MAFLGGAEHGQAGRAAGRQARHRAKLIFDLQDVAGRAAPGIPVHLIQVVETVIVIDHSGPDLLVIRDTWVLGVEFAGVEFGGEFGRIAVVLYGQRRPRRIGNLEQGSAGAKAVGEVSQGHSPGDVAHG